MSSYVDDRAIATVLKTISTLTFIDLHHGTIDEDMARALADVLMTNSTVTIIQLVFNVIDSKGVRTFASAFAKNSTVRVIYLYGNNIDDDGACAVANVLATNSTVTTLSLSNNNIGVDGARALARALATNTTLETFYLYNNNNIGNDGGRAFEAALDANSKSALSIADFSHSGIDAIILNRIHRLMLRNIGCAMSRAVLSLAPLTTMLPYAQYEVIVRTVARPYVRRAQESCQSMMTYDDEHAMFNNVETHLANERRRRLALSRDTFK